MLRIMVGVSHNVAHEPVLRQPELIGLFETLVNVIFGAKDLEGRYVEVNSVCPPDGSVFEGRGDRHHRRDHFIAELAERFEEQDEEVFASGERFDELG